MSGYRFGKHPVLSDYRTLDFKSYLAAAMPPPPASANTIAKVLQQLNISQIPDLFPMDGNDRLGDCTIAAIAHAITIFRGMIGTKTVMSQQDVVKLYFQLTRGIDSGLPELEVLNYWRQNAVDADQILGYVKIDPKNHTHVQQAIALFGGVYLGFQVPENCMAQFMAHETWLPGPLTPSGHAVFAAAYGPQTITMLTWGATQNGTWDWWDECVDEAYVILPPEAQHPNFAKGFDIQALKSDLSAIAN